MRAVVRAMSASAASGTVGSGGSGKLAAAAAVARLQLLAASIEDASSEADPLPPTAICQRLPPTYAAGKTDAKSLLATIDRCGPLLDHAAGSFWWRSSVDHLFAFSSLTLRPLDHSKIYHPLQPKTGATLRVYQSGL